MTHHNLDVADARTGIVRQCVVLCDTCIYRPDNLAHLAPGRLQQLTQAAIANEGHVVCHTTIGTPAPAICAGFARHPIGALRSLALRLVRAGALTLQLVIPPAHYLRDDGMDRCVHGTLGPASGPARQDLADDEPTAEAQQAEAAATDLEA